MNRSRRLAGHIAPPGTFAALAVGVVVIQPTAPAVGLVAAVAIGAVAGLCPVMQSARLAPTRALRSS